MAWLLLYIPKRSWIYSSMSVLNRNKENRTCNSDISESELKKKDRKHIPQVSSWFQRLMQSILLQVILNCIEEAANYILPCFAVVSLATEGLKWQKLKFESALRLCLKPELVLRHTLVTSPVLGWALILVRSSLCFQCFLWLAKQWVLGWSAGSGLTVSPSGNLHDEP